MVEAIDKRHAIPKVHELEDNIYNSRPKYNALDNYSATDLALLFAFVYSEQNAVPYANRLVLTSSVLPGHILCCARPCRKASQSDENPDVPLRCLAFPLRPVIHLGTTHQTKTSSANCGPLSSSIVPQRSLAHERRVAGKRTSGVRLYAHHRPRCDCLVDVAATSTDHRGHPR